MALEGIKRCFAIRTYEKCVKVAECLPSFSRCPREKVRVQAEEARKQTPRRQAGRRRRESAVYAGCRNGKLAKVTKRITYSAYIFVNEPPRQDAIAAPKGNHRSSQHPLTALAICETGLPGRHPKSQVPGITPPPPLFSSRNTMHCPETRLCFKINSIYYYTSLITASVKWKTRLTFLSPLICCLNRYPRVFMRNRIFHRPLHNNIDLHVGLDHIIGPGSGLR